MTLLAWDKRPFAPEPGTALCALDDIPDGQGREFVFGEGKRAFRMFVVRRRQEAWGYVNSCPHFQLPLNSERFPEKFMTADGHLIKCSQHLALFRPEDGTCVDGACPGQRLAAVPLAMNGAGISIGPAG